MDESYTEPMMKLLFRRACSRILVVLMLGLGSLLFTSRASASSLTVTGQIESINFPVASLRVLSGAKPVVIQILPYTWIVKDRWDAGLSNLRVSDEVRISVFFSNGSLMALRIDAQTRNSQKTRKIKGKLAAISGLPTFPLVLTVYPTGKPWELIDVALDTSAMVVRDNAYVNPTDLQPDDNVTMLVTEELAGLGRVTRIEASSPQDQQRMISVSGVVEAVNGTDVSVQTWQYGLEETLSLDKAASVRRGKQAVAVVDIRRGDQILALGTRCSNGSVNAFVATVAAPDIEWTATVKAVNTDEGWLVTTPPQGNVLSTVLILPATSLWVNGADADLESVKVGDTVIVRALLHDDGMMGATSLDVLPAVKNSVLLALPQR